MKKGLRHDHGHHRGGLDRSNADLMKKGLRPARAVPPRTTGRPFKRGPDEEGIETIAWSRSSACSAFKRGPDEEGIETLTIAANPYLTLFKRGPDEEGIETQPGEVVW